MALNRFLDLLRNHAPPQSQVESLDVGEIPVDQECETDVAAAFEIRASDSQASPRPTIPADLATCRDCLAEINDPKERRYRYPFTNCTNCGPRWSIIRQLPYDRPRTSMAGFAMCPECDAEYHNPSDRRFHAQPIACPRCGPRLQLVDQHGSELAVGDAALTASVDALLAGRIVAMKGLGGFQLLADATNADAVARLRERKHRPDRPFALMMPSLDATRQYCVVTDSEAQILSSHQSPIVLLRSKAPPSPLAPRHSPLAYPPLAKGIAPGNPYLGVLLPYTPLHHLLMQAVARPMVCTSGNLAEEPMVIATEDALRRLGPIADVLLTHNRPIVRPVDDSIVRVGTANHVDAIQVLRRARGLAPLPLNIAGSLSASRQAVAHAPTVLASTACEQAVAHTPTLLAVGGHLKNTVALCLPGDRDSTAGNDSADAQVVMSAHIGDLDSIRGVEVFRRAIDDLLEFFHTKPDAVVCDLHPDYASTRHAETLAARWSVPLLRVQHHHAHVAACMADRRLSQFSSDENGTVPFVRTVGQVANLPQSGQDHGRLATCPTLGNGPVLGFAWDGTGYGPDGTVWGGEVLLCDRGSFDRVAHLRTFALPGGDRAARQPRRSAFALLHEMLGDRVSGDVATLFTPNEIELLSTMLARRLQSPRTSSMGRLFDGVAALCGLPPIISFEGQAAMALEFAAEAVLADTAEGTAVEARADAYAFALHCDESTGASEPLKTPIIIDWEPIIRRVLADRAQEVPIGRIAIRFHNALADMTVEVARRVGCRQVALTGGCFQNALLADLVRGRLAADGFDVYTHRRVPPGDGGIALGQIVLALQQL